MRRAFLALVLLVAGTGCTLMQPKADPSRLASEIVGEAAAAARSTPDEQRRRVTHARQIYDAVPSESNGLRYAMLLATLPPPLRDDAKAAAILRPLAAQRPETPLTQLSAMLAATLSERQRLVGELQAAERRAESAAQHAEAAAQHAEAARARAEAAERREASANERANTLQGQVEALKSIERSILQREERRRTLKR